MEEELSHFDAVNRRFGVTSFPRATPVESAPPDSANAESPPPLPAEAPLSHFDAVNRKFGVTSFPFPVSEAAPPVAPVREEITPPTPTPAVAPTAAGPALPEPAPALPPLPTGGGSGYAEQEPRSAPARFFAPSPPEEMGTLERLGRHVVGGALGTAEGLGGALQWITGGAFGKDFGDYMAKLRKEVTPEGEASFIDQLASGAGSMATFFIPGFGVGRGLGLLAKVAPKAAGWMGAGAMAVTEASTEAGQVYRDQIEKGLDPDKASSSATWTFMLNLPVLTLTDKIAFFPGMKAQRLAQGLKGLVAEGSQESLQEVISTWGKDEQQNLQNILMSGAVGAILGGGMGAALGRGKPKVAKTEDTGAVPPPGGAFNPFGMQTLMGQEDVTPPAPPATGPLPPSITGAPITPITPEGVLPPGSEAAPGAAVAPEPVIPPPAPTPAAVVPEVAPEGPAPIVAEKVGNNWMVAGVNFGPNKAAAEAFAGKANAAEKAKAAIDLAPVIAATEEAPRRATSPMGVGGIESANQALGVRQAVPAKEAAPAAPAPTADELVDQIQNYSEPAERSGRTPGLDKLRVELGQTVVPGIRLTDAQEVADVYMAVQRGEIAQEMWVAYVEELKAQNRVKEPPAPKPPDQPITNVGTVTQQMGVKPPPVAKPVAPAAPPVVQQPVAPPVVQQPVAPPVVQAAPDATVYDRLRGRIEERFTERQWGSLDPGFEKDAVRALYEREFQNFLADTPISKAKAKNATTFAELSKAVDSAQIEFNKRIAKAESKASLPAAAPTFAEIVTQKATPAVTGPKSIKELRKAWPNMNFENQGGLIVPTFGVSEAFRQQWAGSAQGKGTIREQAARLHQALKQQAAPGVAAATRQKPSLTPAIPAAIAPKQPKIKKPRGPVKYDLEKAIREGDRATIVRYHKFDSRAAVIQNFEPSERKYLLPYILGPQKGIRHTAPDVLLYTLHKSYPGFFDMYQSDSELIAALISGEIKMKAGINEQEVREQEERYYGEIRDQADQEGLDEEAFRQAERDAADAFRNEVGELVGEGEAEVELAGFWEGLEETAPLTAEEMAERDRRAERQYAKPAEREPEDLFSLKPQQPWEVFDPKVGKTVKLFQTEQEAAAYAQEHGLDYALGGEGLTAVVVDPFFSKMQRHLEAALPGRGTPEDIISLLEGWGGMKEVGKNKNGDPIYSKGEYKKDELLLSGVIPWLKTKALEGPGLMNRLGAAITGKPRPTTVTKKQVLEYLKSSEPVIIDVWKGDPSPETKLRIEELQKKIAKARVNADRAYGALIKELKDNPIVFPEDHPAARLGMAGKPVDPGQMAADMLLGDYEGTRLVQLALMGDHTDSTRVFRGSNFINAAYNSAKEVRELDKQLDGMKVGPSRGNLKYPQANYRLKGELPGTYTEVVMTIGPRKPSPEILEKQKEIDDIVQPRLEKMIGQIKELEDKASMKPNEKSAQVHLSKLLAEYRRLLEQADAEKKALNPQRPDYKGAHFGEKNTMAFVRFALYKDRAGDTWLVVSGDYQSDWASAGRHEGWQNSQAEINERLKAAAGKAADVKKLEDRMKAIDEETHKLLQEALQAAPVLYQIKDREGNILGQLEQTELTLTPQARDAFADKQREMLLRVLAERPDINYMPTNAVDRAPVPPELESRISDLRKEASTLTGQMHDLQDEITALTMEATDKKGVPQHPMPNTWHEYVMKWLLRHAAEKGYKGVGWTTGAQQFKRWGTDRIDWKKAEAGQEQTLPEYAQYWVADFSAGVNLPNREATYEIRDKNGLLVGHAEGMDEREAIWTLANDLDQRVLGWTEEQLLRAMEADNRDLGEEVGEELDFYYQEDGSFNRDKAIEDVREAGREGGRDAWWNMFDAAGERVARQAYQKEGVPGGFIISATEQHQGAAVDGQQTIEEIARDRGHLLESRGADVANKDDLLQILKRVLTRDRSPGEIEKLTDRIWAKMQAEPEGTSMPRKEFFELLYDKAPKKFLNAYAKQWGAQMGPLEIASGVGGKNRYEGPVPSRDKLIDEHRADRFNVQRIISAHLEGMSIKEAIEAHATPAEAKLFGGELVAAGEYEHPSGHPPNIKEIKDAVGDQRLSVEVRNQAQKIVESLTTEDGYLRGDTFGPNYAREFNKGFAQYGSPALAHYFGGESIFSRGFQGVHGIEATPALVESVLYQGQPIMSLKDLDLAAQRRPLTKFEQRLKNILEEYPNADPERAAMTLRAQPKATDEQIALLATTEKETAAKALAASTIAGIRKAEAKKVGGAQAGLFGEAAGPIGGLFDQAAPTVPAGVRPAPPARSFVKAAAAAEKPTTKSAVDPFRVIRVGDTWQIDGPGTFYEQRKVRGEEPRSGYAMEEIAQKYADKMNKEAANAQERATAPEGAAGEPEVRPGGVPEVGEGRRRQVADFGSRIREGSAGDGQPSQIAFWSRLDLRPASDEFHDSPAAQKIQEKAKGKAAIREVIFVAEAPFESVLVREAGGKHTLVVSERVVRGDHTQLADHEFFHRDVIDGNPQALEMVNQVNHESQAFKDYSETLNRLRESADLPPLTPRTMAIEIAADASSGLTRLRMGDKAPIDLREVFLDFDIARGSLVTYRGAEGMPTRMEAMEGKETVRPPTIRPPKRGDKVIVKDRWHGEFVRMQGYDVLVKMSHGVEKYTLRQVVVTDPVGGADVLTVGSKVISRATGETGVIRDVRPVGEDQRKHHGGAENILEVRWGGKNARTDLNVRDTDITTKAHEAVLAEAKAAKDEFRHLRAVPIGEEEGVRVGKRTLKQESLFSLDEKGFAAFQAKLEKIQAEQKAWADENIKLAGEKPSGVRLQSTTDPSRQILIHPSTYPGLKGKWQITSLDTWGGGKPLDGQGNLLGTDTEGRAPSGHEVADTLEAAIREASKAYDGSKNRNTFKVISTSKTADGVLFSLRPGEERQGQLIPGEPVPSQKEFEAMMALNDNALLKVYQNPANKLIPLYEGERYMGTRAGDFIKDAKGKKVRLGVADIYERLYAPKGPRIPLGTETTTPEDLLGPDESGPEGAVEKPPNMTVLRSLREKFSAANISEKARLTHQFIVQHLGWGAREVRKAAKILDKYSDDFGAMNREDLMAFTDAAETGRLALVAPRLQEAALAWRTISDQFHALLVDAKGGESAYWENYFPRLFKNPEQAAVTIAAYLKGRGPSLTGAESFNRARTMLLFSDSIRAKLEVRPGENGRFDVVKSIDGTVLESFTDKALADQMVKEKGGLGLDPRYDNYVDMMKANLYEKVRFLTGKYIQADLIEQGFIVQIKRKTSEGPVQVAKAPSGWEPLTGDKTLEGYYAHPDIARVMENFLSKGLRGDPLFELYNNPVSFVNTMLVGLSAFHATFSIFSDLAHGIGSNLTRAVGAAITGRFSLSGHYLAEMAKAGNIPANLMRGGKYGAEYIDPGTHPEYTAIVNLMEKAGIRFESPGFREVLKSIFKPGGTSQSEMGQLSKTFEEVMAQQMGMPRKVMEAIAWPIMSYMVPRIKINATARMLQMELDVLTKSGKIKDMTQQDLVRLAQEVARKSDNIFGQMVYDNLSMSRGIRDSLRFLIGFPGWNIGSGTDILQAIKGTAQVVKQTGKGALDLARGNKPTWENISRSNRMSMEFYLGTAVIMAIFGALTQRLLKGDWPEDAKDLFMPQTGEVMANGQPERLRAPTYMRDVLGLNHPIEMVKHKLNFPLRMFSALTDNQDFFGEQIRDPYASVKEQAGQTAKYVGKALLPFGIQGYIATESPKAKALNLVGITRVPRLYSNSEAMNVLDDYNKMNRATMTSKQTAEEKRLKGDLRKLAKAEDAEGFTEAAREAMESGNLTRTQIKTIVTESQAPPGIGRFIAAPLQWQIRVLAVATEDEKKAWIPFFLKKVVTSSPEIKIRNRDALVPMLRGMGLDDTADALEKLAISEKGSTFKLAGLGVRKPVGEDIDLDAADYAMVQELNTQEAKLGTEKEKKRKKENKFGFLGIQ